ncbi:hypothetical protein HRbin34_00453 [bacterium HR34]|nr:hypothetical protein HRbin34_00453 [bacterium HR34]
MYYPGMQDNENNFPGNFDNFISEAGYYWRGANLFADEGIGRPWDPGEISAGTKINIIGTQEKENSKYKLPIYKYSWNKVLGWIDSLRGPDRYIIEFFNTQKGSGEYTKEIVKDYLDRFPLNEYPMKSTLPLYGEKAKYDSGKGHWEQGTLVDIKNEDECKNEATSAYILFYPLSNKKCEDFIPTKVDPKYEIRDFTQVNYKNAFKNNLESLEDLYLFYNASNISLDTNDFVYDFYDYLNTVEYYYNRYLPIIKVDFNKKYRGILYPPINDNENYQKMTQCLLKSGTYTDINVSYGYKTGETYNYGEQKIFTSIAPEPKYPFDPDFELLRLGPNVNWVLNYSEIYPESIYGDDLERKKLHQILKEYYANVNLTKWYDESGKEIRLDDAIENNINQLYSTYPVLFEWCPVDYPADYKDNSKGYLKAESYYLKFWHDDFWKEKYSKSEDLWIKETDTNPKWEKYCPYSDLYAIDPTSPACLVNLQGQILGDYHGAVVNKTTYPPPLLKGEVKLTPTTFKTVEPYFRTTLQSFTSNVLYKWSIATCLRDDGIACQLTNNGKPDEKARVKPLTKQEEALGYYYGAEMGQDWIFVGEAEFIERGFITPKKSPTLVNVDTVVKWNPILGYRAYAVELVDVTNGTPGKFAGLAVVTSNEITIGDLWLTKEGYSKPILKPNRTYYLNLYVCSKNPLESPEFTGEHQNYPNNPSLLYKTDSTGLSEIKGAIEESCVNKSTITLITSGAQVKSEKVKVPENIPDKIVITERPNHFDKTPESLVNDYRQGIASYYVEIKEEATGNVFHKIILDPLYNLDYSNPEVTLDYPEIKPGKEYSLTIRTCADRFPDIKDPETIPQERIKAFCGPETSKSFKISELKPPEITYPVNGDKAQVGFNIKWNAPRDSVTPRYYKYEFKYKSKSDDEVSQSCVDKIGSVIKSGIVTHKGTENDAQTDIYCLGDYTLTMYSCIEDKCTDEFISTPVSVNFTLIPSKVSENIFSITPCGRKTDNPKTNWIDEREPCKLVHMFLLVKITFDFLITRFMLIVAVLMVVGIFAANYIIRIPALTHQAITGFKYVLIGYGVAIFGWIIITTIINLLGMKVPLFSIGF